MKHTLHSVTTQDLVRRKQAAVRLAVQPHTLAVWAWRGFGPPVIKIGGLACYRISDLDAFINGRKLEFPNHVQHQQ